MVGHSPTRGHAVVVQLLGTFVAPHDSITYWVECGIDGIPFITERTF